MDPWTLFVKITSPSESSLAWAPTSPGPGWYSVDREPEFLKGEYLEYNAETDSVLIKQRQLTTEQLAAQQKAAEDAALMKADVLRSILQRLSDLEAKQS